MYTNDHTKLFINDEDVIGKWEYYDVIQSEEEFDANHMKVQKIILLFVINIRLKK